MKLPVLFSLGLLLVTPCQGGSTGFESTGNMTAARARFTATLLPEGKVLAVGGLDNFDPETSGGAELFDPASGTWTATGTLTTGHFDHTATLLPDGRVLAAGGVDGVFDTDTAELFDPATGIWTTTGDLQGAQRSHTATLLADGKVLVVAGFFDVLGYGGSPLDTAELYNPATGAWTMTGSLTKAREGHTATLLPNGKVLVVGGVDFVTIYGEGYMASVELYDPEGGTWAATGSLVTPRAGHTATLLPNGKVLVAGGINLDGFLTTAELYDPQSEIWTVTGNLDTARGYHTATLLSDGEVLVVAGFNQTGYLTSADLYHPERETWTATGSLGTAREAHTATLLPEIPCSSLAVRTIRRLMPRSTVRNSIFVPATC